MVNYCIWSSNAITDDWSVLLYLIKQWSINFFK